jgi:hypothetical protein
VNQAGSYNIWGWGGIEERLARQIDSFPDTKDSFVDTLHQAKQKKALCNFQYAMTQDDKSRRKEYLTRAWDDIRLAKLAYPDLGGPVHRKAYDDLLRQVQKARDEKPIGLDAFARSDAAGPSSRDETAAVDTKGRGRD